MNPIDNSELLDYRGDQGTSAFLPNVSFAYDAESKEVDFTDASTFPAGVALKKTHVRVHDKFGGEVRGEIGTGNGSGSGSELTETTVDVSSLDASKGLDVTATVVGDDERLVADGSAFNIQAAGSLGSWDKQKNA